MTSGSISAAYSCSSTFHSHTWIAPLYKRKANSIVPGNRLPLLVSLTTETKYLLSGTDGRCMRKCTPIAVFFRRVFEQTFGNSAEHGNSQPTPYPEEPCFGSRRQQTTDGHFRCPYVVTQPANYLPDNPTASFSAAYIIGFFL